MPEDNSPANDPTSAPPPPPQGGRAPGTITILGWDWSPQSQFKFMVGVMVLMNALLFLKFGMSQKKENPAAQPAGAIHDSNSPAATTNEIGKGPSGGARP